MAADRQRDGAFFFALEGLRGLAALAVTAYHYSYWTGLYPDSTGLLPHAYLAVDFFFVLSGFVIAHAYGRALLAGMGLARFALRRVVRLWPLLVLSLGLAMATILVMGLCGIPHGRRSLYLGSLVLSLALLPTPEAVSPASWRVFPMNGPAWSLSVEMGANLAYAALIGALATRRLALFAAAAGLALLLAVTLGTGTLSVGHDWAGYGGGWLRVAWGFPAGVLVHRLWLRRPPPRLPGILLPAIGLGFLALCAASVTGAALDLCAVLLLFPLAVYLGAGIELTGAPRLVAAWLGHVSYAVYITHAPVLEALKLLARLAGLDLARSPLAAFLLCVPLAAGLAWMLDCFYDRPVRAWLARRLAGQARPAAGQPRAVPG